MLWIGKYTETNEEQCKIVGYNLSGEKGRVLSKKVVLTKLPLKMQGMNFFNVNSIKYLAVSTSCGRQNKSNMFVYYLGAIDLKKTETYLMDEKLTKLIVLPSMIEGIVSYANQFYMIFESAAIPYRNGVDYAYLYKAFWQCDRITITTTNFIYK